MKKKQISVITRLTQWHKVPMRDTGTHICSNTINHCGLVPLNVVADICLLGFSYGLVAWWHPANTWTYVDIPSTKLFGIYSRVIFIWVLKSNALVIKVNPIVVSEIRTFKITGISPKAQWVNHDDLLYIWINFCVPCYFYHIQIDEYSVLTNLGLQIFYPRVSD